ncbi:MAG: FkbM family methyltransferase [Acidobacteriia bacterium]|nr:FkbM family methyltransferase [Terriglobia bacterium]
MARLNAVGDPNVRYVAAKVGFKRYRDLFPDPDWIHLPNDSAWDRTSAVRAMPKREYESRYDPNGNLEQSAVTLDLDDYFSSLDFLKTDTDGHDIEVLLGAERLIGKTCWEFRRKSSFREC